MGTNGEIALIADDRIWCCAAAAGPAFEGANIEHGVGALQGAINYYYGPGNFKTIGDAKPVGICGSGLIDLVAYILRPGYVSADGYLEDNLRRAGLTVAGIDALYLAGGFGNYIRKESAEAIGLIHPGPSEKVIPVGNTSGTGAMLAVRSVSFDKVVSETLNRMSYIELSDDDDFVLQFALNMEFPYLSDLS